MITNKYSKNEFPLNITTNIKDILFNKIEYEKKDLYDETGNKILISRSVINNKQEITNKFTYIVNNCNKDPPIISETIEDIYNKVILSRQSTGDSEDETIDKLITNILEEITDMNLQISKMKNKIFILKNVIFPIKLSDEDTAIFSQLSEQIDIFDKDNSVALLSIYNKKI